MFIRDVVVLVLISEHLVGLSAALGVHFVSSSIGISLWEFFISSNLFLESLLYTGSIKGIVLQDISTLIVRLTFVLGLFFEV